MTTVAFPQPFSPFQAARDEYLLAIEMEGKSPSTVPKCRDAINRLGRFAGEPNPGQSHLISDRCRPGEQDGDLRRSPSPARAG